MAASLTKRSQCEIKRVKDGAAVKTCERKFRQVLGTARVPRVLVFLQEWRNGRRARFRSCYLYENNKGIIIMARKIRGDIKIGNLEKKLGVAPGTFRNSNGRDTRSDKLLKTLRKEAEKRKK